VTAFEVVEHLVVMKDIRTGNLAGWVDLATDPFTLEQLEEAFSRSFIVAAIPPTRRCSNCSFWR